MENEKLWQKNLLKIEPYVAGEQSSQKDIVKLNANENPYPPSHDVQKVIDDFHCGEFRKYPNANSTKLVEAISKRYGVDADKIFVGNGSDDVLATAFRGFFNSEKPIFYPDITYSFYPVWCDLLKIPYKTLVVDDDFRINPKDYYAENGGVVIANPNAPTSIGEGREFIEDIIEHNQDCIVIVDEAYVDFGGISSLDLIDKYENLLVVQTFSKSRSMAGMRIGMAFGNPQLIAVLNAVKDSYNSYPLDSIAIETGAASMLDENYFQQTVGKIIDIREKYKTLLEKLGFNIMDSQTNFLFASHKKYGAKEIFEYLKTCKVFVRFFNKPRIDNWLRITVGTEDEMQALCAGLEKMFAEKSAE